MKTYQYMFYSLNILHENHELTSSAMVAQFIEDLNGLENKNDKRMRFNNSKDPIYFLFDYVENKPMSVLAKEFVKDTYEDICNFVSKVVA